MQLDLPRDCRLEDPVGRPQRSQGRLSDILITQDADVDHGVAKITGRINAGHRDKAQPRIAEVTDGLADHLSNGFVDSG